MTIMEMLERNSRVYPEEISLIERAPEMYLRREISWYDFEAMSNQFAQALISKGVKKGDRVALIMFNCLEWLPVYFGILKTGALAVPLNFRYTPLEIKNCLNTAAAKMLVFGPEFTEAVAEIKDQVPTLEALWFVGESTIPENTVSFKKAITGQSKTKPEIGITDADPAALYFTSGTTGVPKSILLTHANLVSAAITENRHHLQSHEDNFLCIPPLYHTGAKMHWLGSLIVGGKAVLLKGVKPEWILEAVSEEKVTIVWLLVPWAQDILDALDSGQIDARPLELKQWRLMHIGAQPVPPALINRWRAHFPHQLYDTNYGLSEATGPGCIHLGTENQHKVGAIGKPGFNWEAIIVDEQDNEVKTGMVGELLVRGPGVMQAYFNNPEATEQVLKHGWLYTGDMAKKDRDGFIFLVDRKKDVVISGGENIYPVEIEDFLRSNVNIKDSAVIGMPHPRLGEIPIAIVELKPECILSEQAVLDFCSQLPRYKRPRHVFFDQVPRNPTGKIEKPRLRVKYFPERIEVVI